MRTACSLPMCIGLAVLASGCATVTRGTTESLAIQSEPSGAQVRLSSGQTGITPCSFELKRKKDLTVSVAKDGFVPAEMQVESKVAGAGAAGVAGNVIIGVGIDAATGAAMSLKPNPVHIHLIAADPAQADAVCPQDNPVASAICHGTLHQGSTREEVLKAVGEPQERKSDDMQWRYGHDTIVFDDAGRFASTVVVR